MDIKRRSKEQALPNLPSIDPYKSCFRPTAEVVYPLYDDFNSEMTPKQYSELAKNHLCAYPHLQYVTKEKRKLLALKHNNTTPATLFPACGESVDTSVRQWEFRLWVLLAMLEEEDSLRKKKKERKRILSFTFSLKGEFL